MLFLGLRHGRSVEPSHPFIATPFGEMTTFCTAGALDTRHCPPSEQTHFPGGAVWRAWRTDDALAELFTGPLAPTLPEAMAVDGCSAAIWRLQASAPLAFPAITCQWATVPADADGGPSSGQWLDAQTWDIGAAMVSLGTEDGEHMAIRAHQGVMMPKRLEPLLHVGTVDYLPGGLCVPFHPLQAGELVQVQFIIAWTLQGAPDRVDTWFAVEQDPREVLRKLGIWSP
jgi:hypothetical protein